MFSESARDQHRLPGINLGTGCVSLPYPATAGYLKGQANAERSTSNAQRRTAESAFRIRCSALGVERFLLLSLQLGRVCSRFSKLRREDLADAFPVDQMSQ